MKDKILQQELEHQLELHFKCDCLACVDNTDPEHGCKNPKDCEVAKSYFRILELIKRWEDGDK